MPQGQQPRAPRDTAPADERIRDAARSVFARNGYAATTMDAIAAAAGVTKPTVYARYASKEQLHRELVDADGERLLDHLLRASLAVGGTSFQDAVRAGVRAYFSFFEANPETYGLLFSATRTGDAGHVADRVTEQVTHRVSSIALGIAEHHGVALTEPDARLVAAVMLGAGQGAIGLTVRDPNVTTEQAEALTLGILMHGLLVTDCLGGAEPA